MFSLFSVQPACQAKRRLGEVFGVVVCAIALCFVLPIFFAAANTELPIATTVLLEDTLSTPGMVVRYTESTNRYSLSRDVHDAAVYGVVGERPAIVFVTASNTIPVVTQGVSGVLVDARLNGPLTGEIY